MARPKEPAPRASAVRPGEESAEFMSRSSAERPATVSGSFSSAEQPGTPILSAEQPATPSYSKILSIRDVQRWLTKEPIASSNSADAQRIREAVAVLSQPKPRQEDLHRMNSKSSKFAVKIGTWGLWCHPTQFPYHQTPDPSP